MSGNPVQSERLKGAVMMGVLDDPFANLRWMDPRDRVFVSGIDLSVFLASCAKPWDGRGVSFMSSHGFSRSKAFQSLSLDDCLDLIHDTPELTLASIGLLRRFLFTVVERDGYKEIDRHDFWEWFRTEADKPRWQGRLVNPAFHEDLKPTFPK